MTFVQPPPQAEYTDIVEAAFGYTRDTSSAGWVWTDITKYVVGQITITKGRPDATSTADPCHIQLTLDNSDGRFTKGAVMLTTGQANPLWPYVVRGVPLRVRRTWKNAGAYYERATAFVGGWPLETVSGVRNGRTQIDAWGRLRQLRRDGSLVASPLRRLISASSPVAYWPLEDGSDATSAASLVAGVHAMRPSGSVVFGGGAVGGTAATVDFTGGGTLYGALSGGSATDHWGVLVGFEVQDTTVSRSAWPLFMQSSTGMAAMLFYSWQGATGAGVGATLNPAGAGPIDYSGVLSALFGTNWTLGSFHSILMYTVSTGVGKFQLGFIVDGVDSGPIPPDITNSPGALRRIDVSPDGADFSLTGVLDDPSVVSKAVVAAHVAAWQPFNPSTTITVGGAGGGYDGESATTRIARLAAQGSIAVTTASGIGTPQSLGPQGVDTLGNLLDAAADADCGLLHDGGTSGDLYYASPGARYNATAQITIGYAQSQISDGLAGTDDDQTLTNDVTITRSGGSSGEWVNTASATGEGRVTGQDTLNLHDDDQPDKVAQLRANLSSYDAMRFPFFPLDLRRNPELVQAWTGLTLPAYMAVTGVPSPYPTASIDQFIEGYTEVLDAVTWQVVANCSPAAPWRVMRLDDTTNPFRLDSSWTSTGPVVSSQLVVNAGVSATATSFGLKTLSGPLVTTSAGDFPVLIEDATTGEVMRLTNVTGASSPQTATVVRSINGVVKALGTNDSIRLYRPAGLAL